MTEEEAKKAVDEYLKERMKYVDYLNNHNPDVKDLEEATRRLIEKILESK